MSFAGMDAIYVGNKPSFCGRLLSLRHAVSRLKCQPARAGAGSFFLNSQVLDKQELAAITKKREKRCKFLIGNGFQNQSKRPCAPGQGLFFEIRKWLGMRHKRF